MQDQLDDFCRRNNYCTCRNCVKQLTSGRPVVPSNTCDRDNMKSGGLSHDSTLDQSPERTSQYDECDYRDDAYTDFHNVRPMDADDDVLLLDVCAATDGHCRCHIPASGERRSLISNRRAVKKLIVISAICFVFMTGEFIGGYLSQSLAIMTDAAHLLSDLAGFLISLIALWVARRPGTAKMTFGYFRAEILGAVTSVLIIWALTLVLVYLAIMRIIHDDYDIDANIMLITAGCGVLINIVLLAILQFSGHGHSHFLPSKDHGHSHSHGKKHENGDSKNLNIRAAFIHCIGDLLQSIGILIAAVIIKVKPSYKLADPICTFLFSVIVLFTTLSILKEAFLVLMEGIPSNMNYKAVKEELESICGVHMAHSLHIWSLTTTSSAMMVHLAIDPGIDSKEVLAAASHLASNKLGFSFSTIQVEDYVPETMDSCRRCIGPSC